MEFLLGAIILLPLLWLVFVLGYFAMWSDFRRKPEAREALLPKGRFRMRDL
jgi:hypothetical protein